MLVIKTVTTHIDDGGEGDADVFVGWRYAWDAVVLLEEGKGKGGRRGGDKQPINNFIMRKAEYKLINHAIYTNCSTHELKLRVLGVIEDKMITVEIR